MCGGLSLFDSSIPQSRHLEYCYHHRHSANFDRIFIATLKNIIPLPNKGLPLTSSSHPDNLEEFQPGARVLALYPDTTTFYRATVVSPPEGRSGKSKEGHYWIQFEDDGEMRHEVEKLGVLRVSPCFVMDTLGLDRMDVGEGEEE